MTPAAAFGAGRRGGAGEPVPRRRPGGAAAHGGSTCRQLAPCRQGLRMCPDDGRRPRPVRLAAPAPSGAPGSVALCSRWGGQPKRWCEVVLGYCPWLTRPVRRGGPGCGCRCRRGWGGSGRGSCLRGRGGPSRGSACRGRRGSVAAAHGDHDVGGLDGVGGQQFGVGAVEVDADLGHGGADGGVDLVGGGGSGGADVDPACGVVFE